ncbi:MAG: hypothetical protein ALECFALPRED_003351 [Alectoria fallacina]|uniref:Pyroglutamyl-peptidase I n=1 Tax=Alectoria fallacina TaxID=1903189 RepID=A0A8H3FK34_9LECA|nr:MAG: hypothetical protein ALECFALPRED_003351 [Alectoria fallacina]
MGSLAPAVKANSSKEEINVLVTGFGPFGENTTNPAYQIARSLPDRRDIPGLPPIILHCHPKPITVSYAHVREIIPELLFPQDGLEPKFDIVLNIGLAPGRHFYTMETLAHRDGYNKKDVDGNTLEGDTFWQIEYEAPETLYSSFDTKDVWRRWKSGLMKEDLRPSNNAGHYLCDFTYYASLLEYWRREPKGRRPCMFLHVPNGLEEEDIRRGREAALGLIAALVASEMAGHRSQRVEDIMEEDWDRAADDECS